MLPPLRERKTDIPPLIRHFIEKYAKENRKQTDSISKEAQDYLMKSCWLTRLRLKTH